VAAKKEFLSESLVMNLKLLKCFATFISFLYLFSVWFLFFLSSILFFVKQISRQLY